MSDNIKEILYHEDQYRMIEFIPKSNYFFSKKYQDQLSSNIDYPNEFGFESISVISEQPNKLADEKILLLDIKKEIDKYVQSDIQSIKKGYSNSFRVQENAIAWGLEYSILFVEYESDFVKNIWLLETGGDCVIENDHPKKLKEVIHCIGNKYDLILIDWDRDLIVDISSLSKTEDYLINELNYNS